MKINFLAATILLLLMSSCKKSEIETPSANTPTDTISSAKTENKESEAPHAAFDINTIPMADNITGSFPYFKLPEGYTFTDPNKYHGTGVTNTVDMEYFYNHGIYFPMEGKTYKAVIRLDSDHFKDKVYSTLELKKSFDEFITGLGGVKINNGETLQDGENERLKKEAPHAFSDGYLHSSNNYDNVNTYVIRTKEKTVLVQLNIGSETSNLTVLEPKAFENKMSMIPAAEIQKQLDATGKAVLYINFDTDQATLKPEGEKFVAEIEKLLQNNKGLRISIEGHTDNTGQAARNRVLSEQRATTVLKALTSAGIQSSRLMAKGFGSDKPLVANDSESNKAKNRRVELVRL